MDRLKEIASWLATKPCPRSYRIAAGDIRLVTVVGQFYPEAVVIDGERRPTQ